MSTEPWEDKNKQDSTIIIILSYYVHSSTTYTSTHLSTTLSLRTQTYENKQKHRKRNSMNGIYTHTEITVKVQ